MVQTVSEGAIPEGPIPEGASPGGITSEDAGDSVGVTEPFLNHVEMVHAPGERALAGQVFSLLGCEVVDNGGTFMRAEIAPGSPRDSNNVLYVSEVTPEQWALEEALRAALAGGALGAAADAYRTRLRHEPQRSFHFGIRLPSREAFDARLAALRRAPAENGELAGRLEISGIFFPGDEGAYSPTLAQAFVWTDVFASGLLTVGQHLELQLRVA